MAEPARSEPAHRFEQLHNFRDVGGIRLAGGCGEVRTGVLFRSDSPHEASAADIDYLLNEVRVATLVDLRSERELRADGTNPLMPAQVQHRHFPIAGGAGGAIEAAPSGRRLAARYREYLDQDTANLVAAVRAVARSDGPTVVHCRVGKDRTGIVVALVLDALGADPADIAHDYQLTTGPMREMMKRLRASPTYAQNASRLPAEMYSSPADAMEAFLEQLHADDGGAANWLLTHGLTEADLAALQERLVTATSST